MKKITAGKAKANLEKLIDRPALGHKPIQITGKRNRAVLVSEKDWSAMQEKAYLLSIPGMRESIVKGLKTPLKSCKRDIKC
jgi:prevent-host-death family protein